MLIKHRVKINDIATIKACRSIRVLVIEARGPKRLECLPKDCRNYVETARTWRLSRGYVLARNNMFVKSWQINSDFFYAIDTDNKGRLKNILLVDGRSHVAYKEFHDVVCFDSTYLVNKYDMPFVVFVGVNHYRQSILFGCALVSNEEAKKYEWVFGCKARIINCQQLLSQISVGV